MRERNVAEVQPAIDVARLQREARRAWVAVQDAERRESGAIEDAARKRVELGRVLIEARKGWPRSGPKAKGWGEFLAGLGIESQRASELMRLAGYVEEISPPGGGISHVPSLREAGIKPAHLPALHTQDPPDTYENQQAPASNVELLIKEGVAPREAALIVIQQPTFDWMTELEHLAQSMRSKARALFSNAEALDVLCRQHDATVASPAILTMRSMLVAAKGSIENALALIGESE